MMKNIELILIVILFIICGLLFYRISGSADQQVIVKSDGPRANIVYINSDTLLHYYPLVKKMEAEFSSRRDSVDRLLQQRDRAIKQEYASFEQRAPSLSEEQQQREYEGFMRKQQDLEKFRDDLLKHLSDVQDQIQDSIHDNLHEFLKSYNRSHGYDYIMSYQRGSGILLANDSLDITDEVLKTLKDKK